MTVNVVVGESKLRAEEEEVEVLCRGGGFVLLSLVCGRVLRSPSRPGRAGLLRNRAGVVAETGAARLAGIIRGDGGERAEPPHEYLPRNTPVLGFNPAQSNRADLSHTLILINVCLINN